MYSYVLHFNLQFDVFNLECFIASAPVIVDAKDLEAGPRTTVKKKAIEWSTVEIGMLSINL